MAFTGVAYIPSGVPRAFNSSQGRFHSVAYLPPSFPQGSRYMYISEGLGDLEGWGSFVKKVTGAVKTVAKVVLRAAPGAVAGFVTGGPIGAVVGAAASYESTRKATSGLGSGIQVGGLLKGAVTGAAIGAVAGVASSVVAGAVSTIVSPATLATVGYFPGLSTGLIPGVSSTAMSMGGGLISGVGTGLKAIGAVTGLTGLLGGVRGAQQVVQEEAPISVSGFSLSDAAKLAQPIASAYGMYTQAELAQMQANAPSMTPLGIPDAQYTGAQISGGGFVPEGISVGGLAPVSGLFGIPWNYWLLGGGGLLLLYIIVTRPKKAYSKNPRRRGRR